MDEELDEWIHASNTASLALALVAFFFVAIKNSLRILGFATAASVLGTASAVIDSLNEAKRSIEAMS